MNGSWNGLLKLMKYGGHEWFMRRVLVKAEAKRESWTVPGAGFS
ncbi:hypothetical protein [Cytobacillus depressus]|nr:hypothetical protein [Cytobacillus depressus]